MNGAEQAGYRFQSRASQREVELVLVPTLRKIVGTDDWQLGDREYRDHNAHLLFQKLSSAAMRALWLDFNKRPTIIEEIVSPIYSHLIFLYLGDNNVASISAIVMIDAPVLEKLYLNHNKITCLKSLRMAHFPALAELNLNGNCIAEEGWLSFCHFPKAAKLNLGYLNKKQQISEQSWYVKAELNEETLIQSPKAKLGIFTPKLVRQGELELAPRSSSQRNLFKTFQS